jgi:predicted molibdopterin-dependent oxidoreductase YjgC
MSAQGGGSREELPGQGGGVMIELMIDGHSVEIEAGASVLDAARQAGIYVPTLCEQPDLKPYGGCRLCVVEIEGSPGLRASCTTPAQDGMRVQTNTQKIQKLRRNLVELLLSEHPSACLVCGDRFECWEHHECTGRAEVTTGCKFCPQGERCELKLVANHVFGEGGPEVTLPSLYKNIPVDRRDPFIDRDDNLCILCGRCVRACEQYGQTYTLDFVDRGSETRVGTAFNRTLIDAGCRFCGSCVDACPTGSLSERVRRWDGSADHHVRTTCSFCSVGCQFDLGVKNGRVIEALPRKDGPVNAGDNCVRGRFAVVEFNRSIRRLKSPLIRRNGELVEVPWETALLAAAEGIKSARPEKSALLYSGYCTNESVYFAHKFAREVLGTEHVDSAMRLSYGPLLDSYRNGSAPVISAITEASAVFVIGADPDFSHPVLAQKIKNVVANDTKLVIMAPHATGLSRHATSEIRHKPGEERLVLESLYVRLAGDEHANVHDDVKHAAQVLEEAEKQGPVIILFGSGVMRRLDGTANKDLVDAVANALPARVLPLLSAPNDRGAMEIAAFFGSDGLTAPEIFSAAQEGQLDFLYLIGEDLPPGDYNTKFVVVQDMFLPAAAGKVADVVFPVASFVEVDGTYTNMEARVQRVRAATKYAMGTMSDCDILSRLAGKLDAQGFDFAGASEVMDEVASTVPFYGGVSYDALDKNGGFFGKSQSRSTGKEPQLETTSTTVREPRSEQPDKDYPLSLIAEFDEYVYKATRLASQVRGIRRLERAGTIALSPSDAGAIGIETGMPVRIVSRRGSVVARAAVSGGVQEGVAKVVAAGGDESASAMLDHVFDAVSKTPEELCAVRIEKV